MDDNTILPASPNFFKKNYIVIILIIVVLCLGILLISFSQKKYISESSVNQIYVTNIPSKTPSMSPTISNASTKTILHFIKPVDSVFAKPGEVVPVVLSGTDIAEVLLVGHDFADTRKKATDDMFSFEYKVPELASDDIVLQATGKKIDGTFIESDKLIIKINHTIEQKVVKLKVATVQETLLLSVGETEQLNVIGTLADGTERDLTAVTTGTKYILYPGQPLNMEIIKIDDKGQITALHSGNQSIVVTHKDYEGNAISVNVLVQ